MITNTIFLIVAYLLGNILGGKILNLFYKEDFSTKGSKNIGARNAGRILGAKAFLFVATIDFFKGFFVVIVLKLLNTSIVVIALAMLLVVLGHIKPVLYNFKGGKGVATFLGALFALSPNIITVFILGIILIGYVTRSTTIGFYSALPVLVYVFYVEFKSLSATLVFIVLVALMIYVSTSNIKNSFNRYFGGAKKKK